jgi:hypothetical protein
MHPFHFDSKLRWQSVKDKFRDRQARQRNSTFHLHAGINRTSISLPSLLASSRELAKIRDFNSDMPVRFQRLRIGIRLALRISNTTAFRRSQ